MAPKYILDTHALVWYLEGNPRLGSKAKAIISAVDSELVLPLIALAEAAFLIEKSRISIPSIATLLADVKADARIAIQPLTEAIFQRSVTPEGLRVPELHDRFIVSTGLYLQDLGHTVFILTKDQTIASTGLLTVIW